jgi:hypothetical protein
MTKHPDNIITWGSFHNIIPLVTSAVMVTISFMSLSAQVALLNQKVDNLMANQKELLEKYSSVENRYGKLTLEVKELQTILSVKTNL